MYKFYIFFVSFFLLYACHSNEKSITKKTTITSSFTPKKVEKKWFEEIKNDSNKILFVVLDPHGDALLAKNTFKKICYDLNINMISPYTVKNNSPDFVNQIDLCIKQYSPKKQQIYLVGFSGGARMAYQYAISHQQKTKGVIMCGAGIGKAILSTLSFPLVMIAGKNDFNMIEQYYSPFNSQILKNTNVISLLFNGKHEWPDSYTLKIASEFLISKTIKSYIDKNILLKDYQNSLKENAQLISYKYLELLFKSYPNDANVREKLISFLQNTSFQKNITKFENRLQFEQKRNQMLAQNLYNKDWKYWKNQLKEIDKIISTGKKSDSESYSRTKAFLGVVVYSLCKREMQNSNSTQINKLLKIYETLEPNNEEMLKMKEMVSKSTVLQ